MKIPCTLYLQILELYSFLIEASCYSPEIRDRPVVIIKRGETTKAAFNAVNRSIDSTTITMVFSHCKPNPGGEIAEE
jgi:hypothetical protein